MPCGDAGRERHAWSYLLIATSSLLCPDRVQEVKAPPRQAGAITPTSVYPAQVNDKARWTEDPDGQSLTPGSSRASPLDPKT